MTFSPPHTAVQGMRMATQLACVSVSELFSRLSYVDDDDDPDDQFCVLHVGPSFWFSYTPWSTDGQLLTPTKRSSSL